MEVLVSLISFMEEGSMVRVRELPHGACDLSQHLKRQIRTVILEKVVWCHVDAVPLEVLIRDNPQGLVNAFVRLLAEGGAHLHHPGTARRREMPGECRAFPEELKVRLADTILERGRLWVVDGDMLELELQERSPAHVGRAITDLFANPHHYVIERKGEHSPDAP